jgi:hypothetical protein
MIAKESLQPEWIHQLNKLKKTNYQPEGDGFMSADTVKNIAASVKYRLLSACITRQK